MAQNEYGTKLTQCL